MSKHNSASHFTEDVQACLEAVLAAEAAGGTGNKETRKDAVIAANTSGKTEKIISKEAGVKAKGRVVSLASGSRANCTLVEYGDTVILVDFGLSCRMAEGFLRDLGVELARVNAVFITHEHTDHVSGLNTLLKKYDIPVHMTEPSFLAFSRGKGFDCRNKITVHSVEYECRVGELLVSACEVSHDSAACVSYLVTGDGFSFCSCTDLGYVPERVFQHICRAENVILESNHDITLLKTGDYPENIKYRISSKSGHLSNNQCADILKRLRSAGVKRVLLGHVSPENNDPDLALESAIIALQETGEEFDFIGVAPRLSPMRLI